MAALTYGAFFYSKLFSLKDRYSVEEIMKEGNYK